MTNTPDEKILNKIKKCLALSASSEPHEAAAAMRQAQKLMEMHGISQIDVQRSDIGEANVSSKVSVSKVNPWELKLMATVADAFGCKLLWIPSYSWSSDVYGRYTFIGLKSQIELAQYTAEVMQRKLMKSRAAFAKSLPSSASRAFKSAQLDGFCLGWTVEVKKTVHAFALSKETEQMITEYVKEKSTGKAKSSSKQYGTSGMAAGREAGANESIHRPMGQRAANLMIGA
jgi:hypothetical protein